MSRTATSSILLAALGPALLAAVATAAPPGSELQGGHGPVLGRAGDDVMVGGRGTDTCQEESDGQHSCER